MVECYVCSYDIKILLVSDVNVFSLSVIESIDEE